MGEESGNWFLFADFVTTCASELVGKEPLLNRPDVVDHILRIVNSKNLRTE